jgi:hypothetical protein
MKQNTWILNQLKQAPLTPMEALAGCGCFRLAARIKELRQQGHDIQTKSLILPNGKIVAQYILEQSNEQSR